MGVVVLDACQQATCSFAQRLPLLNVLAVELFGIPIFAVLIHFAVRSWRSARLDLRERRRGAAPSGATGGRVGARATATATATPTMVSSLSAYAKMIWSLSVALLCADWLYFATANIVRLATSQPTDLKPPVGSSVAFYLGVGVCAVSLVALAVLWKMRPREALPPMLKRTN
ncbi:MAG TPA: hypothetical protein VJN88_13330 [Ktedonobacterales bacterium]|nr:hypothetical protein [Ktedonobacterales bacterium]